MEQEHWTLRVLYCKHFPFPSLLWAPQDLSQVNVVSAFYPIQVGRAYSIAAVQHPSHMRGNLCMVYRVLLLPVTGPFRWFWMSPLLLGTDSRGIHPPDFLTETCFIIFQKGASLQNGLLRKNICEMHPCEFKHFWAKNLYLCMMKWGDWASLRIEIRISFFILSCQTQH